MKKFKTLLSFAIALCSVGVLSSGGMEVKKVEAEGINSKLTISSTNKLSLNGGTIKTNDSKDWSYTKMTFVSNDDTNGGQIGSSKNPTTSFTMTTNAYNTYNIKSIKVESKIAKDGNAKFKVSIGDNYLGNTEYTSLSTDLEEYTFDNNSNYLGEISVNWTNTAKAFYLQSITVVYSENVGTKYTVSFATDGGTAISDKVVSEGEKISRPVDPEKEGYKFGGWYSDSSYTTLFDFDSVISEDITIYAKWIEKTLGDIYMDISKTSAQLSFGFACNEGQISKPFNLTSNLFNNASPYSDVSAKIDEINFIGHAIIDRENDFIQMNKGKKCFIANTNGFEVATYVELGYKTGKSSNTESGITVYGSKFTPLNLDNYMKDGTELGITTKDGNITSLEIKEKDIKYLYLDFNSLGGAAYFSYIKINTEVDHLVFNDYLDMSLNFRTQFDFTGKTQGTDFTEAGMMIVKGSDVSETYSNKTAEALPEGAIKATQTNYGKEFIVRLEDIPVKDWNVKVTVVPYILIEGTYYFGTAGVTSVIDTAAAYASSDATITLSDESVVNVRDVAAAIEGYYNSNNNLGE